MRIVESADNFACEGASLIGIATLPEQTCGSVGLVVLVGGPQYRVGSHRQFALLCRCAASAGYPALRFDYRGMGDSSGEYKTFEQLDADVDAAITRLQALAPSVRRVVLWGLCTAASTAMMYAPTDARVAGLVLVNPWVRDDVTIARTQMKHYYVRRLATREFWSRLVSGQIDVAASLRSFARSLRDSTRRIGAVDGRTHLPFQTRMARAMTAFQGRSLLLLSGNDMTAKEFVEYSSTHPEWHGVLDSSRITRHDFPDADHTFSTAGWRAAVEQATVEWLATV